MSSGTTPAASGGASTAPTETSGLTSVTGGGGRGDGDGTSGGGGRGGGRGRGRNRRGRYRGGNNNNNNNNSVSSSATKDGYKSTFKGNVKELEDFVYDLINPADSADRYETTTERIAECIATEWTGAGLIKDEILLMEVQSCPEPEEPTSSMSTWETKLAEANGLEWIKDMRKLAAFRRRAMGLMWGQCADSVRSKIEGTEAHKKAIKDTHLAQLLELIENVMLKFHSNKKTSLATLESKFMTMGFKQKNRFRRLPTPEYFRRFKRCAKSHKRNGGGFGCEKGLVEEILKKEHQVEYEDASTEQMTAAVKACEEQMLAILFMVNSDQDYHGELLLKLKNDFSPTKDDYPPTLDEAHQRLINFTPTNPKKEKKPETRTDASNNNNDNNPTGREVAFSQTGTTSGGGTVAPGTEVTLTMVAGLDGRTHPVTCHKCNRIGHCQNQCPTNQDSEAVQMLMNAEFANFSFLQDAMMSMSKSTIPWHWWSLDNQSTVCCFKDKCFLRNIRKADRHLTIHCNAGKTHANLIGDLPGFPEPAWCAPTGIANILSLDRVEQHFPVTYENKVFTVHKPEGGERRFIRAPNGLRHWDSKEALSGSQECALVNTAADKESNYSVDEHKRAVAARKTHEITGQSLKDFLTMVDDGLMMNNPITRDDVKAAEDIFGPSLRCLQGKTARKPSPTHRQQTTLIPPQIYDNCKEVTIHVDIMFVNKIPFLVTTSEKIRFVTAEFLPNRKEDTVLEAVIRVKKVYNLRRFLVRHMNADSEFEKLRADLCDEQIALTTVAEDEHVPEVERCIRTVKERTRCVLTGLKFRVIPTRMLIELILGCVMWLNFFPPSNAMGT